MLAALETLILAAFGVLIGSIGSIIGLGGGFLAVPLLIILFGFETNMAVGTSLLMMTFVSVSGTIAYLRQRRVDLRVGILFGGLMLPGAVFGAYLSLAIVGTLFKVFFSIILVSVAAYIILNPYRMKTSHGGVGESRTLPNGRVRGPKPRRRMTLGYLISVASGFLTSTFGIGAGSVQVPTLSRIVGLPLHSATATSFFMIMLISVVATASHSTLNNVVLDFGVPLGVGGVIGAQLGAVMAGRMRARLIERILGSALVLIGVRLLVEALGL